VTASFRARAELISLTLKLYGDGLSYHVIAQVPLDRLRGIHASLTPTEALALCLRRRCLTPWSHPIIT
jgi:hypothetical protein